MTTWFRMGECRELLQAVWENMRVLGHETSLNHESLVRPFRLVAIYLSLYPMTVHWMSSSHLAAKELLL